MPEPRSFAHGMPGAASSPENHAEPERAPKARDVARFGDMSRTAFLRIGFDGDGDAFVCVSDEHGTASVEFCVPGFGGGHSPRTRDALVALMVAIEDDNAQTPDFDWWARRMGRREPD